MTAQGMPEIPAIDVSMLQALVGDDPVVVRDLLAQYQSSARRLAAALAAARVAADVPHIEALAHQLKSSSRSVGAVRLGDLCADLEDACQTGAWQPIAKRSAQVETELIAVIAYRA